MVLTRQAAMAATTASRAERYGETPVRAVPTTRTVYLRICVPLPSTGGTS